MNYKEIEDRLGLDRHIIARIKDYKGKDPYHSMISSTPWRSGQTQKLIEYVIGCLIDKLPKLSEEEVFLRRSGEGFIVELCELLGADTSKFKKLHDAVVSGTLDPTQPKDAEIIRAEELAFHKMLEDANLTKKTK